MSQTQDFKHHGRIVPIFHVGVFFPFVINFFWSIYRLIQSFGLDTVVGVITAIGLLMLFFAVRVQVLTVQDRVIRLEMRLRLAQILPAAMHPEIKTLTVPQLVALRFAGDTELQDLTRDVLTGKLATQKEIKQRVKDWQADFQRA